VVVEEDLMLVAQVAQVEAEKAEEVLLIFQLLELLILVEVEVVTNQVIVGIHLVD
jgi:hypothetical protein